MKLQKQTIIFIIALVVVAGGAFYGGMLYKGNQASARTGSAFGQRAGTRFASGANFVTGTITAKDDQSITVKSRDGSSKIILYSPSTEVGKFVSGNVADVVVGANVMASGKTNSDGSITAQSIQLRPAMPAN